MGWWPKALALGKHACAALTSCESCQPGKPELCPSPPSTAEYGERGNQVALTAQAVKFSFVVAIDPRPR